MPRAMAAAGRSQSHAGGDARFEAHPEGWTPDETAINPGVAQVMSYPSADGFGRRGWFGRPPGDQSETITGQVRALRDFLADARAYADVKAKMTSPNAPNAPNAPRVNQAMESLVPVIRGEAPVIFDVRRSSRFAACSRSPIPSRRGRSR